MAQTLSEIRAILESRGLRPRHRLGQNFLHDKNLVQKLVDVSGVVEGDLVLEVGPGTGTLTETLLARGVEVVACELDADLATVIEERCGDRVKVIRGDCLEGRSLHPEARARLGARPWKLVANLPYQVASPLMVALLLEEPACRGQWVTIQKEVGDRLLAVPGTKAWGPLGIIVQALARPRRLAVLKPSCFWPAPEVTSMMIEIVPRDDHGLDDPPRFARFVTELFGRRRKQLGTIFGRDRSWPEGVEPTMRPEALTVEQLKGVERWSGGSLGLR